MHIYVGLPSVMKNFVQHEQITMHMSLSMTNVDKLQAMCCFQPSNLTQKTLDHSLRHIFVDNEPDDDPATPPIIYEIASAGIMELSGPHIYRDFSATEFNSLLHTAVTNLDKEDTLLSWIRDKFSAHLLLHPRSAYAKNIAGFIANQFENSLQDVTDGRLHDVTFMEDVAELQDIINTFLLEDRYSVQ